MRSRLSGLLLIGALLLASPASAQSAAEEPEAGGASPTAAVEILRLMDPTQMVMGNASAVLPQAVTVGPRATSP